MKKFLLIGLIFFMSFESRAVVNFINKDTTEVFDMIRHFLPENPIILEAGAFNGNETNVMKKFWPDSIIYSFEPVPEAYNWLVNSVKSLKDVYCFSIALSNKTGYHKFYLSEERSNPGVAFQSGSLLQPKDHLIFCPDIIFKDSIVVPTITIDKWAKIYGVSKIDMMWLDMQGMELEVLKASPNIMSTVKVVYTEVEFSEVYFGQGKYDDMKKFMEQNGFIIFGKNFEIPGRVNDGWGWFGDVIFIRSNAIRN